MMSWVRENIHTSLYGSQISSREHWFDWGLTVNHNN